MNEINKQIGKLPENGIVGVLLSLIALTQVYRLLALAWLETRIKNSVVSGGEVIKL